MSFITAFLLDAVKPRWPFVEAGGIVDAVGYLSAIVHVKRTIGMEFGHDLPKISQAWDL